MILKKDRFLYCINMQRYVVSTTYKAWKITMKLSWSVFPCRKKGNFKLLWASTYISTLQNKRQFGFLNTPFNLYRIEALWAFDYVPTHTEHPRWTSLRIVRNQFWTTMWVTISMLYDNKFQLAQIVNRKCIYW